MRKCALLVLAVTVALMAVLELSTTAVRAQTPSRNPDDYHAAFVGQNAYPTIEIGRCYQFVIQFRNTGRATWYRGVVNLGTDRPRDRIPGFIREDRCSGQPSGWINPNRVELRDAAVPPGGVGTFVFSYTVPSTHAVGVVREYFRPVADGVTWMEDCGCYWDVTVRRTVTADPPRPPDSNPQAPSRNPDDYHAAFVGQSSYPTLLIGGCHEFVMRFRNAGRATWFRGVVNLGTDRPRDRVPGFIREGCLGRPSGWINPNRVELREASVPPGGVGTFTFSYKVPNDHAGGTFREYFRPVADGVTWMEDCGCYWDVRVIAPPGSPEIRADACDTPMNGTNCVWYARCRVPSIPRPRHGLFTYAQKMTIMNSSTPRVGAVAIMNVGLPAGHLAIVEQVHADGRVTVREANYGQPVVRERTGWPAQMRVTGYYQP